MSGPVAILSDTAIAEIVEAAVHRVLDERDTATVSEWANTREAAAILGCHPKTAARLAKSGVIPARRLGNHWRFKRSRVVAYLEGGV